MSGFETRAQQGWQKFWFEATTRCLAQNKFFRAKMEFIYDFEKWLYLGHFLTQMAEN